MKEIIRFSLISLVMVLMAVSCRNSAEKKMSNVTNTGSSDTAGLVLIGKDMITDIVLKPDTTGDPWEAEKVKGFDGVKMFKTLLDNIYSQKLTAYDCREDVVLKPENIKELENNFGSDLSKIGKVQFTEDWYFDNHNNSIIKKIKSVAFGYTSPGPEGMPVRYNAFFRIKSN